METHSGDPGRLRWTPWGPCWGSRSANACQYVSPAAPGQPPAAPRQPPAAPQTTACAPPRAPRAPTLRPACAQSTPTGRPKSIPYSIYNGFSDFQDPGGPGHGQPGFTCPLVRGIPAPRLGLTNSHSHIREYGVPKDPPRIFKDPPRVSQGLPELPQDFPRIPLAQNASLGSPK